MTVFLRSTNMISVTINGETRRFDAPLSCAELIDQLALTGKRVALERNGEIVPRSRHAAQPLADGDRLEIVVAVGGG
jgi:sulfur carrier protein